MKLFAGIVLLFCCFFAVYSQFTTIGTDSLRIVNSTKTYASVPPTWLTSPYFRAGNQAVIQVLTGNNQTPTFTFSFSSALTGSPDLAYGIKNYRGNSVITKATTISGNSSTRSRRSASVLRPSAWPSRSTELPTCGC
jgi:hypothetical protein